MLFRSTCQEDIAPKQENYPVGGRLPVWSIYYSFDDTLYSPGAYVGHEWKVWTTPEETKEAFWGSNKTYIYEVSGFMNKDGKLDSVIILRLVEEINPKPIDGLIQGKITLKDCSYSPPTEIMALKAGMDGIRSCSPAEQKLRNAYIKDQLAYNKQRFGVSEIGRASCRERV